MSTPASFEDTPIARVSEYWNTRPCNVRHSPKPAGTREYFDEVEARKYFVEPHIPRFAEFERWKGKKVLEIGCGIGTDTISFARAGAQVTAVDLTEKSLEMARQRARVFGLEDRIRFLQADAEKLSETVPVERYDLVYSFGVIHHTPHPAACWTEIRKYTGPDSTVKIMVYNRWSWKVLWILYGYGKGRFWKLRRLIAEYSEAQTGCPVTYSYSRSEGTAMARRPWLPRHRRDGGPHFPLPHSGLRPVPLQGGLVFPLDAQGVVSRPGARLRLASLPHGQAGINVHRRAVPLGGRHRAQRRSRRQSARAHAGFHRRLDQPGAAARHPLGADRGGMESAARTVPACARRSSGRTISAPARCASSRCPRNCTAATPTPKRWRSTR